MTEEVEENGDISNDEPAPEEKQEPVTLPEIPKPTATVPRKSTKKSTETVSGIDVTANMDSDQKERFEQMRKKANAVPIRVDTERDFCKRHRAIKERRRLRRLRN